MALRFQRSDFGPIGLDRNCERGWLDPLNTLQDFHQPERELRGRSRCGGPMCDGGPKVSTCVSGMNSAGAARLAMRERDNPWERLLLLKSTGLLPMKGFVC